MVQKPPRFFGGTPETEIEFNNKSAIETAGCHGTRGF